MYLRHTAEGKPTEEGAVAVLPPKLLTCFPALPRSQRASLTGHPLDAPPQATQPPAAPVSVPYSAQTVLGTAPYRFPPARSPPRAPSASTPGAPVHCHGTPASLRARTA